MHEPPPSSPPSRLPPPVRPRVSWGAATGFGILGLLWPILRLVGLESLIGASATAVVALAITSVIWVLGAGLGHVPRPVLTLTLSGVISGLLLVAATVLLGEWPDAGPGPSLLAGTVEVGRSAGFGTLCGLVAKSIQKLRRR